MRGWEVICTLVSAGIFAGGGLLAQAAPSAAGGPNVEAWIGTGGSLGILGSLLYYLVTKHNPRQDERYDKLVTDNAASLKEAQKEHSDTMKVAMATFKGEMEAQRLAHERTLDRLGCPKNLLLPAPRQEDR